MFKWLIKKDVENILDNVTKWEKESIKYKIEIIMSALLLGNIRSDYPSTKSDMSFTVFDDAQSKYGKIKYLITGDVVFLNMLRGNDDWEIAKEKYIYCGWMDDGWIIIFENGKVYSCGGV